MKALMYLMVKEMKNRIRKLMRNKGLCIFYIVLIVIAIGSLITYSFVDASSSTKTDIRMLYTIILGLGILFLYSSIAMGFSKGGTLFSMSDVGLLFVAPISPKRILVYGLIKQLGTTFLSAIFIIFQVSSLKTNFNLNTYGLYAIFIAYAMLLFFCQLISITFYVYSNGNEKRKQILKLLVFVYFAVLSLWFLFGYLEFKEIWKPFYQMVDSEIFLYVPVLGWTLGLIKGGVESNITMVLLSFGQYALFSYLMILSFSKNEADFYESVLVRTENNYEALQNMKERKGNYVKTSNVKLKEKNTGIRKGKGASTILYKQIVEMKRESKIPFLSASSIIMLLLALGFSYFGDKNYLSYVIFGIVVYMQFIFTIMGKLDGELHKPYIYLIPEPSIKKLVYSCLSGAIQPFLEGILVFVIVCIVGQQSPMLCLFLAIAVGVSGLLFSVIPVLFLKVFGEKPSRIFTVFIELILLLIILMPGIIISVIKTLTLSNEMAFLGTVPYIIDCLIFSALIFYLCRNIFDHTETGC